MKPAEAQDLWRRLRRDRVRAVRSFSLSWSGLSRLSDGRVQFDGSFSLLCGENGVGKSTLLHALFNALALPSRRNEGAIFAREDALNVDSISLTVRRNEQDEVLESLSEIRRCLAPENGGLLVSLLDPALQVPAVLEEIRADANFAEELEPLGQRDLDPLELGLASYIIGRDYAGIGVKEVDGSARIGTFPYFTARVSDFSYGSEDMGFGELSLLLILWRLMRTPSGSIVLLEEPETFVAPRSQRRLADVIAKLAVERDLMVIATSHSPSIAANFLLSEMTLLSRSGRDVVVSTPPLRSVVDARLELVPARKVIWVVEDEMASRLLRFFLRNADLHRWSEVCVAGDNGRVLSVVASLRPAPESGIRVWGALDGNERGRGSIDRVIYLPGDLSPERFLRRYVTSANSSVLSAVLAVTQERLRLALGGSEGLEDHAWVHAMRGDLGLTLDDFVAKVMSSWSADNGEVAAEFQQSVYRIVHE